MQAISGLTTNTSTSPAADFSFPASSAFEVIPAGQFHDLSSGTGRTGYEIRLEDQFGLAGEDDDYNDDYLPVQVEKWTAATPRAVASAPTESLSAADENIGTGSAGAVSGTDAQGAMICFMPA